MQKQYKEKGRKRSAKTDTVEKEKAVSRTKRGGSQKSSIFDNEWMNICIVYNNFIWGVFSGRVRRVKKGQEGGSKGTMLTNIDIITFSILNNSF